MTYLVPHTSEWFDAMRRFDTQKTTHTGFIIYKAKTKYCCSICGDTPAIDYKSDNIEFSPGVPVTMRLCDDCFYIRTSIMKEKFSILKE